MLSKSNLGPAGTPLSDAYVTAQNFAWPHAGIVDGRKVGLQTMFIPGSMRNTSQVEELLQWGQTQWYHEYGKYGDGIPLLKI